MENLANIIESILFYSGDAVDKSLIKEKLGIKESELSKALDKLDKKYNEESGIKLLRFRDKIQFATNSKYSESVDMVLKKTRERALSKNILETVAIIAYKQPITRLEIEEIRGGAPADYAIRSLLEHNLIEVVGRKEALGRPLLFGTTDEFLKRFNLHNIDELPDYDSLMSEIKELNSITENSENLYKDYEVPTEEITTQESFSKIVQENREDIKKIHEETIENINKDYQNEIKEKNNQSNNINNEENIENIEINNNIKNIDEKENFNIDEDIDEENKNEEELEEDDVVVDVEIDNNSFEKDTIQLNDDDYVDSIEIKTFKKN